MPDLPNGRLEKTVKEPVDRLKGGRGNPHPCNESCGMNKNKNKDALGLFRGPREGVGGTRRKGRPTRGKNENNIYGKKRSWEK